ncbi:MAG: R3H domain-containing nucleic acid-binding protein [Coriobacteriia bacterium]|nr:R3H domain-containing nucleic acid-binding protein [Coriobacteriia bacterium]
MAEEFESQEAAAEKLVETTEEVEEFEEEVEEAAEEQVEEAEEFEEEVEETDAEAAQGITDEELDYIADAAIAFISDVLSYMNVGEVEINEYEGDEGELILDLTGDDLAILIGRHGKTLDALQFLVSTATARMVGYRYPVVVDVEGYKGRQREKLESIALNAADRAASQNRSVRLRPMTPYERRIIHITLADDPRVETASEGEGAARRVVVLPL